MPSNRRTVYYSPTKGYLPNAAASPDPWTYTGGVAPLLANDDTEVVVESSGATLAAFVHKLHEVDSNGVVRTQDAAEIQVSLQGVSQPTYSTGASAIVLAISDGMREIGVSVGATLQFIDPTAGTVISEVATGWSWNQRHRYKLRKDRARRWVLFVDDEWKAAIPYGLGVAPSVSKPVYGLGILRASAGKVRLFDVEAGLNRPIPRPWQIERLKNTVPKALRDQWTEIAEAGARATLGVFESVQSDFEEVPSAITAATVDVFALHALGDRLPSAEVPAWTQVGGTIAVTRQRIKMSPSGGASPHYMQATTPATPKPNRVQYVARATFLVESFTADAEKRVGPMLELHNGHRGVYAYLREVVAGSQYEWRLSKNADSAATFGEVGQGWRVDVGAEHTVEVLVFGRSVVYLVVDGYIVDRVLYSVFTGALGTDLVRIGAAQDTTTTLYVSHASAGYRMSDNSRRPLFLQAWVEANFIDGGCSLNDEKDLWMRHQYAVAEMRGTKRGAEIELQRICCSELPAYQQVATLAGWNLEKTWPQVSPVYLDSAQTLLDLCLEFPNTAPLLTPEQIAYWAAKNLLPISTVDMQYEIALASAMTGPDTNPIPTSTRLTVATTKGFGTGDTVEVRNAANTVLEETTVVGVVSATQIDVQLTVNSWVATDVLRKVLAKS